MSAYCGRECKQASERAAQVYPTLNTTGPLVRDFICRGSAYRPGGERTNEQVALRAFLSFLSNVRRSSPALSALAQRKRKVEIVEISLRRTRIPV